LASVGEIETIRLYPDHEGALRLVLGVDPKAFRPSSLLHCNMEMVNALCKEKYASLLSMCWKNRRIRNLAGIALHPN
jgi:hypothetical protein